MRVLQIGLLALLCLTALAEDREKFDGDKWISRLKERFENNQTKLPNEQSTLAVYENQIQSNIGQLIGAMGRIVTEKMRTEQDVKAVEDLFRSDAESIDKIARYSEKLKDEEEGSKDPKRIEAIKKIRSEAVASLRRKMCEPVDNDDFVVTVAELHKNLGKQSDKWQGLESKVNGWAKAMMDAATIQQSFGGVDPLKHTPLRPQTRRPSAPAEKK